MYYTPEEGEDILRLEIDENIRLLLYREDDLDKMDLEDAKPIGQSHNKLGNNINELVARNLRAGTSYAIQVLFADEEDDQEAFDECTHGTLDVKMASS